MSIKAAAIDNLSKEWNILRDTSKVMMERRVALFRIEAILSVCHLSLIERLVASGALKQRRYRGRR